MKKSLLAFSAEILQTTIYISIKNFEILLIILGTFYSIEESSDIYFVGKYVRLDTF